MLIWDDGSLEILNVSKSDEGSYTCYAENDRGKSNSTGTLTISGQTDLFNYLILSNLALHTCNFSVKMR